MIYVLIDPRNDFIRYVGFTSFTLTKRLKGHIKKCELDSTNHKDRWIRELLSLGLKPEPYILDSDGTYDDEIIYIKLCREYGYDLTNTNPGGTGDFPMPEETKEKLRKKITGFKHSDEAKEKIRVASVKMWEDPDKKAEITLKISKPRRPGTGALISKGLLGKKRGPSSMSKEKLRERGMKISASLKGKVHTKEQIKKSAEGHRKKWQEPEYRSKMMEIRKQQGLRKREQNKQEVI
jgi:hypothetical protein